MRHYQAMQSGRGGWRYAAMVAGLGSVLVGCAAPLSCTQVGCQSAVSVDVSSLSTTPRPLSAEATLCVAGVCNTQMVTISTEDGSVPLVQDLPSEPKAQAGMQVPVTLKVVQGSTVLLNTSATATLIEVAPNGTACGPICNSASLVLNGETLQQSPPPTASG